MSSTSRRIRTMCAATLIAAAGPLAGLAAGIAAAGAASPASATKPEWIRQFGTGLDDYARGVATGPDGRVHVVGLTFGHFGVAKGDADAFIVTFDRDGNELWRRQPGTSEWDVAEAVATDADGNVYVAGETLGSLGGQGKGSSDVFVIKYDRDGHILWKRQPGTRAWDAAQGVAVHANGSVFVTGYTSGPLAGEFKGSSDAFVIAFDADGQYLWKRQPGTRDLDTAQAVATLDEGSIAVAGVTGGALAGANKGGSDAFVITYDRDGRPLWKRQPGTLQWDNATGVAMDSEGSVLLTGWTEFALGGTVHGYIDAFVIKYDRNGRNLWRVQPGTPDNDQASGIATDANDNAYVVGDTEGSLGGASHGYIDAFVIKYDHDGRLVWSDQPGTPRFDSAAGVATDIDGNAYVIGTTQGTLPGNTSRGHLDAFLIKYGPM